MPASVISVFVTGNNHPGNPEKQYFRGCYQILSGVVVINFLIVRFSNAIKNSNWPQPAGGPGIEHIFVLF
jgi:hypothetical protein